MIDSGLCSFFPDMSSGYCGKISCHLLRASQMFILPAFRARDHGSCSTIVPSNQVEHQKIVWIFWIRPKKSVPEEDAEFSLNHSAPIVCVSSSSCSSSFPFSTLFSPSTSLGKVKPLPSLGEDNPCHRRWPWTSQQHCFVVPFLFTGRPGTKKTAREHLGHPCQW